MTDILDALKQLDVADDNHWTDSGLPRLDVVSKLTGKKISRDDLGAAAKNFNRTNPDLDTTDEPSNDSDDADTADAAEPTPEQEVEAELQAATKALDEAKQRHKKAVDVMDSIIAAREKKAAGTTSAEDIKTFQKSQFAQRAKANEEKAALAKFLIDKKAEIGA